MTTTSRRSFLAGAGGAALTLWVPPRAGARRLTLARAANAEGTTLATTIVRGGGPGYVRLREGAGWPLVPRADLGELRPGRDRNRRPIAAIVHLTDVHVIDAQSPGRVEFLDRFGEPFTAAFRPQETLTTQVQTSMVDRVNSLRRGPVTGRELDCAVSTGDNIDNCQRNELEWFMAVLDGGDVTPNSGDRERYEGVQLTEWADPRYWHPDGGATDQYRGELGFPEVPGMLDAAIGGFRSPGLDVPWYSTYGNHDGLIQGNLPRSDAADRLLTAAVKVTDLEPGASPIAFVGQMLLNAGAFSDAIASGRVPSKPVTADERRRTIKQDEWIRAHLDSTPKVGAPGHGYTEDHLDNPGVFFRFQVAPGVVGLSLDTGAYNSGSVGESQVQWLERELAAVHSRYFDSAGNEVRTQADDQLVLLFSHFTIETLTGFLADPVRPDEPRLKGPELVQFLHRWPNVAAWINGHTHSNGVRPVPDPAGRVPGFWQITTASHVDYPEQARIVELADNGDGTVSIFCTMIEHAAPPATDYGNLSVRGLASISRELAANNDPEAAARHLGPPDSRNVELGWTAPFDLVRAGVGEPVERERATDRTAADGESGVPGWVLGAGGAAVAAGAVGAAVALRRRNAQAAAAASEASPAP